MVAVEFVRRLDSFQYVQFILDTVKHLQFAELLATCVGLSPTSPKKGASPGPGCTDQRGHLQVPVQVAEMGLGPAGRVPIPQDIWDAVATHQALSAMSSVEVPRKRLRPEELAMTQALIRQGHLSVILDGMRGSGLAPSAPIFVIPKTATKCSFIVNCTLGNQAHRGPNPHMILPNLHTLRHKFIRWAAMPRSAAPSRWLIKLDLTNCFPSLKIPESAWGTFRVQGPADSTCDLRSLLFGWKLSPAICQEVVGRSVAAGLSCMPAPRPNTDGSAIDYDHYLDDLLFVQEDRPWLEMCGRMLPEILQLQGYIISHKSQLQPVQSTTWLGKDIDLKQLSVGNSQYLRTRIFSALINIHGRVVRAKTIIRVLGLIGWLAAPKKGHLPFLAGVWTAVSYSRSEYIRVTGTFWRSLVSASLVAMPDFRPPPVLSESWLYAKWIAVDAAEYVNDRGAVRYRVGLYSSGRGRVFECPSWVSTQQVAEMYGMSLLVKFSVSSQFPQVTMLRDNMQTVWGTVNLRARTRHSKQQRILRGVVHRLRTSQLTLHVTWVPSHLQPADPLSRVQSLHASHIKDATRQAAAISSKLTHLDQVKPYGVVFVPR